MAFAQTLSQSTTYIPFISIIIGYAILFYKHEKTIQFLRVLKALEVFSAFTLLLFVFLQKSFEYAFLQLTINKIHVNFGFRADELSTLVLFTISIISFCVFNYSIRYLAGERKYFTFFKNYQITLFFVYFLVLSNNLISFLIGWIGISIGLHKLLTHYDERPGAILGAQKKWFVSRLGDLSLFIGIILTFHWFKTLNFSELITMSDQVFQLGDAIARHHFSLIGLFIALSAMAKSAQFPLHFWLLETFETPTPVSAFMHAGIINAGGYLILRCSPILAHAVVANSVLIVIGGLSAVFGALVMMTQTDIKKQLGYSTMSQLGFMMFECGILGYTLALFHLIMHAFYKAYLFLAIPTILTEKKAPKRNLSNFGLMFSFFLGMLIIVFGSVYHLVLLTTPKAIYFGILMFSLTQIIGSGKTLKNAIKYNFFNTFSILILILSIYFLFQFALEKKYQSIMPIQTYTNTFNYLSMIFVVFLFMIGIFLTKKLQNLLDIRSKRIWIFLYNGAYFKNISTRLITKISKGGTRESQ